MESQLSKSLFLIDNSDALNSLGILKQYEYDFVIWGLISMNCELHTESSYPKEVKLILSDSTLISSLDNTKIRDGMNLTISSDIFVTSKSVFIIWFEFDSSNSTDCKITLISVFLKIKRFLKSS